MKTAPTKTHTTNGTPARLELSFAVTDPMTVRYLLQFEDAQLRSAKVQEALKVGVIAIQSATPTLDTQVVQSKFAEMNGSVKEQLSDFQEELCRYFKDEDGVVPRSMDDLFGDNGRLTRIFQNFFDPNEGRLSRLMQTQIGPESLFGKALDPDNKQGIIALIEARIQELVEAKLDEVLHQFSLDEDGSAMSRLNAMLSGFFEKLNQSLGIKTGTAAEAIKGHVKGIEFEKDLYGVFAEMGRQLGDETELVRGTVGAVARCKKGDYVSTLGETSGAPGLKLTVEVKDQPVKLKDAVDELPAAKENRAAAVGIFVFARGAEPPEIGDFRRIGEDFYVTVDKDALLAGTPLLFLDAAYKIARALTIATARKESAGELDVQKIQDQLDALATWSQKIADMSNKARAIQINSRFIEETANNMKQDFDNRVATILQILAA